MKQYSIISLLIVIFLSLVGCSYHHNPSLNPTLTHETWMYNVNTNPNAWAYGADSWFLTGDPNATELMLRHAPYGAAISTMAVNVPDFRNIKTNGDFQVQIFGTYGHNSVYVYGPNDEVRNVAVEVRGNTLCLNQAKNVTRNMRKVIIRIGVNQLNNLIQMGSGPVEGIQLRSALLNVTSTGMGSIYLAGMLNVGHVVSTGAGCITIFGANALCVDITTSGSGSVNISGQVGLRSIRHHGRGNINIIGAVGTNGVKIYADGKGKIGIAGEVNLKEVDARDATCVYVCNVTSNSLYVYVCGNARVGLAGRVVNLYVTASKGSRFEGRALCADNAFARARDWAHINVAASTKIFAAATDSASIYFFGSPTLLSQFISGNGTVIPIFDGTNCKIVMPIDYKGESRPVLPAYRAPVYTGEVIVPRYNAEANNVHYTGSDNAEVDFSRTTRYNLKVKKLAGAG